MPQNNKIQINYLFYGIIFLFVTCTTIANIFFIEHTQTDYRNFFILHCIIQSLIEICSIILIGFFLERHFPKYLFNAFLGLIFLFFITHVVDFILIRIMDLSIWNAFSIILDETFSNFIELLTLTGLPLPIWIILFLATCSIPLLGIFIYNLSKKISNKKPLSIKNEFFIQGNFCLILSLFLWDLSISPTIRPDIYRTYKKSLPWKTIFLSIDKNIVELKNNLKIPLLDKNELASTQTTVEISKKPNIYIFIVESLREDFITENISPNLFKFKKENISFDLALSNSNNTHCSWFSILYSLYPFYWAEIKKNGWEEGSLPLNFLKKNGYKINVLTSSQLHFYQMDELLFGKDKKLLDSYYINNTGKSTDSCKSDLIAINKLIDHPSSEGNLFLIFLESSHFHYSWPDDFKIKFKPIADNINPCCVTYASDQQIEAIRNRYRNALNYLDSLFEKFIFSLKQKNIFEDSIIVVTGDHGEEFFEKGRLFHASHLSHVQTHVPIYYKLGPHSLIPKDNLKITSHVDIFPSIFDYIFGNQKYLYPCNGQSIFLANKSSYVLSTRYNGGRTPNEFFIHDGKNKVILKFSKKNIFDSKELEVVSIRDIKDEIKLLNAHDEQVVLSQVKKSLDNAFSK